ncbi:MAG: class I SAM-dependent methyltransferase [Nitrososphaerota archaeon]|nr:class I SAM-dependent methyltransferase [Nitrososphaerota archaeon]
MIESVDWSKLRQTIITAAHRAKLYSIDYWDKEASVVNKNIKLLTNLTKYQIKMLPLSSDLTVLDVGAGTGRMTLPIAKKVRHVTALEPSENMLRALQENARQQQLFNIDYVNKPLEELGLAPLYDFVVASFSLFMFDLKKAILKMNQLASKQVYLFMSASPWVDEDIQTVAYKNPSLWSDFILSYNILYDAGIVANAEIFTYTFEACYPSIKDATETFIQKYSLPSDKRNNLTEYLQANLIEKHDGFYYKHKKKAAMVWWNTNK